MGEKSTTSEALAGSVLLAVLGVAAVLVALVVLAGWPWALLAAGVALLYGSFVASTHAGDR